MRKMATNGGTLDRASVSLAGAIEQIIVRNREVSVEFLLVILKKREERKSFYVELTLHEV